MAGELARSARVERQDLNAHTARPSSSSARSISRPLATRAISRAQALASPVHSSRSRSKKAQHGFDLRTISYACRCSCGSAMQALEKSIARAATYRLGATAPHAVEGGRSNAHSCRLES